MSPCTQLLSLLLLSLATGGVCKGNCSVSIKVRRDQFLIAHSGHPLEVECPVHFCPNKTPSVFWNKITRQSDTAKTTPAFQTRWDNLTETTGVFYLVFSHVLLNHSGEYRCETNFTKGHNININVTESTDGTEESTDDRSTEGSRVDALHPYLYSAAGIFACVVMVIILSVVSMRHCPGNPRTSPECQHTVMTHHPSAQSNPGQATPSDTPLSSSPAHHPTQKPSTANQMYQNGCLYSNRQEEEEEEEDKEDKEEQSVWYAALNHSLLPVAPDLRSRDCERATEYTTIRVP